MTIGRSKNILDISCDIKEDLQKKQYGIFKHSGVQICTWNKKSLTKKGVCYKEKAYGVNCHSCMQFSPVMMLCQQRCTFCWRPMEYMKNIDIKSVLFDEPKDIIENLIWQRKKLLLGFNGNCSVDRTKYEDSLIPSHYAISLSGEPTLYPKLNDLVKYLKTLPKTKTIFIVSNGQENNFFENLIYDSQSQPTQLYISIDAPSEELFQIINNSMYKDGWERLNKSLESLSKINTRTVFRMTQIKGLNDLDEHLEGYKKLIEKGKPDFIEIKAYMYLGLSRKRHSPSQMPYFDDVIDFARKLQKKNPEYEIGIEVENSLIIILRRIDSKYSLNIDNFEKP